MAEPISLDKPEFHLVGSTEETEGLAAATETAPDTPFRVLLLGDFAGRASRAAAPPTGRRLFEIDRDDFDAVLGQLGVELRLSLPGAAAPVALRFGELEDFHPDRIYERLDIFRSLRETRRRLGDPSTFDAAADEVRSWADPAASASTRREGTEAPDSRRAPAADASGRDLLEQMLGRAVSSDAPRSQTTERPSELTDFGRFLGDLVRPHLASVDEGRKADLTGAIDEAAAELMRAILHHPDFQSLEAAWRAAHFLVSRTETGETLKLCLLDLTREELTEGLRRAGDGTRAVGIGEVFSTQPGDTRGDGAWALLVGNYTFDRTAEDAELLQGIAGVARLARAPFVAGASMRAAGIESFFGGPSEESEPEGDAGEAAPREWDLLRRMPEARYLGLAAPRFLLRLPYGAETDAAEQFDFEEMGAAGGAPRHEEYLWGNPAFACAHLLAEAFTRAGWDMRAGDLKEIEGLPLHVYEEQGETRAKPCAEVLLTERAAGEMLERGVMPLLSFKDGDHVRLARFQSLAYPAAPLAGRWS